jgi:hypothetical protein
MKLSSDRGTHSFAGEAKLMLMKLETSRGRGIDGSKQPCDRGRRVHSPSLHSLDRGRAALPIRQQRCYLWVAILQRSPLLFAFRRLVLAAALARLSDPGPIDGLVLAHARLRLLGLQLRGGNLVLEFDQLNHQPLMLIAALLPLSALGGPPEHAVEILKVSGAERRPAALSGTRCDGSSLCFGNLSHHVSTLRSPILCARLSEAVPRSMLNA